MASYRGRSRNFEQPMEELAPLDSTGRSYTVNLRAGEVSFSFVKKVKPLLSGGSGDFVYDEESEDFYSFRNDWLSRKGDCLGHAPCPGERRFHAADLDDGDFVLFDTSKCEPLDGKIMVIGIDNHLYIKRVRVSPEGIFLVSDNKRFMNPGVSTLKMPGFWGWLYGIAGTCSLWPNKNTKQEARSVNEILFLSSCSLLHFCFSLPLFLFGSPWRMSAV